jgi:hypothetical protein
VTFLPDPDDGRAAATRRAAEEGAMRTPVLDEATTHRTDAGTARRRRAPLVLAVGALALVTAAAGVGLALATRPAPARAPAPVAAPTQDTVATPPGPAPRQPAAGHGTAAPTASPAPKPVLADESYDGYVRRVDVAHRKIVVDLVQVFEGDAAVKAAAEDGQAGWVADWYVRNQNSLLRTLPVAGDVRLRFYRTCEGEGGAPPSLSELGERIAKYQRTFYYHFTVRDGMVQRMEERLSHPAC